MDLKIKKFLKSSRFLAVNFGIIRVMDTKILKLEDFLTEFYESAEFPTGLAESAKYSLLAGGKRIRPLLF